DVGRLSHPRRNELAKSLQRNLETSTGIEREVESAVAVEVASYRICGTAGVLKRRGRSIGSHHGSVALAVVDVHAPGIGASENVGRDEVGLAIVGNVAESRSTDVLQVHRDIGSSLNGRSKTAITVPP